MKKLLTILFLFTHLFSKAQTGTVIEDDAPDRDPNTLSSIPWFDNNNYLQRFLDSIGYPGPNEQNSANR